MNNVYLIILSLALLFTACSRKYPLDLGRRYHIDYDGNSYFYLLDKNNTVIVDSHIINLKFDSVFIVIEQKPVDSILKGTYNNPKWNLKKRDRLFEESALCSYWIINKRDACSYGPYPKNEYLKKLLELKVPHELFLN